MNIEEAIQLARGYYQEGDLQKAESTCREILVKQPNNADVLMILGEIYYRGGDYDAAIHCIREALKSNPNSAEIYNNLGLVLQGRGNLEEAIEHFRKANDLNPDIADGYYNLGIALKEKGQLDETIACYQKALGLNPENSDAYINLGIALKERGRLDEAIASYQKAIELDTRNADAYVNLSIVLKEKGQLNNAIDSCRKALDFDPANAFAFINMGNALLYQGKPEEATECFKQALKINQNLSVAGSNLLCSMNYSHSLDQEIIFKEHRRFSEKFAEPLSSSVAPHTNNRVADRKLRVGYISPDFRGHSAAYFIEPVLASHDMEQFEIFCYENISMPDEVTERLQKYTDQWRSIVGSSDGEAAEIMRRDGIDILVDLAGHTANNRILIFARKPAPIQVSWIGYPATTGLSAMDYKIVDRYTDPPGMTERYYTEKLLRLPGSFLCYLPDRESPEVSDLPALKAGYVTFGSFNNFAKVTPEVIRMWVKILKGVPGSRLILKAHSFYDGETCRYAREMFMGEGIGEERVELLPPEASVRGHLALYSRIDIGLDTFPYNGTTTTCEALWMGVPVITLAGETHVSRVGVSILSNVGLPELIAQTPEAYVRIAVQLASDLGRLRLLRGGLREMMKGSPLTDAIGFTASLEQCYREIWKKWCRLDLHRGENA